MSRIAAKCRYPSTSERQRPYNGETNVNILRDTRIVRAAVVGLVFWLGACIGAPSGPGNGATMSGTVMGSQGGALANATVTVTPAAGTALPAVQTTASGAYTVDDVPSGDGTVTVSNVPANCEAPSAIAYTGIKNNGKRVLNITAPCQITLPSRTP
jgi:hypothetical protein